MNRGFIVILTTLLVLSAGLVIVLSAGYISLCNVKIVRSNIYSVQAYYAAEAGIEDSLLRLNKNMDFSKTNNFTVGDGTATIEIADPIGGSRTIISSGDMSNRIRKVRAVYVITADRISFHYGAQVGDGGMIMENNSRIKGNVFSNGSIIGTDGKGYIDNTVKVATIGSKITGLEIGGDAHTHICEDCTIGGTLYYSGGSPGNCNAVGGSKEQPVQGARDLPISDEQITEWKNDALAGGIFDNNYIVPKKTTDYLGPRKIQGDLTVEDSSVLILTGTLWVTGKIVLSIGSLIKLDSSVYGSTSGVVVADGKIDVENNVEIQGSGQERSYTMFLSADPSMDPDFPAININNNAQGAIFYTSKGIARLRNNMQIREATGYALYLDNTAVIEYESGLDDIGFVSGPGASWEVAEWKEIE